MCYACGIRVRAGLVPLIYQKSLRLSPEGRGKHSTGKITNMMSVDSKKIENIFVASSCPLHFVLLHESFLVEGRNPL